MNSGPILAVEGVSKHFGALAVTDAISFELQAGAALGIVGPNGAGKTTLLNLIAGDLRPDAGRIVFDGDDVTRLATHVRCNRGIGRTSQIPRPFEGLTVFENVLVGANFGGGGRVGTARRDRESVAYQSLVRTGMAHRVNTLGASLTLLERKRLELARALATKPKLLLLDEIAGGLTEAEVLELVDTINDIRRDGVSIVWIEHIVHALLRVVDTVLAIDAGRKLVEGDPAAVMASDAVRSVYLGSDV